MVVWVVPGAEALGTAPRITQFTHDSWTPRTGAPTGAITSITQTPDGYLWLGTAAEGLSRFDGVRFRRVEDLDALFPLRADEIRSVLTTRDGTLWVGTAHGIARRVGGHFEIVEEGRSRSTATLAEAPDGRIVFARDKEGLGLVDGTSIKMLPTGDVGSNVSAVDLDGTLWIGTDRRLLSFGSDLKPRGIALDGFVSALYADKINRLWVATRRGLYRLSKGRIEASPTSPDSLADSDITTLLEDRDGGLWAGTTSSGLRRIGLDGTDSFGTPQGLTSNGVTALFQDREGSLWVGTSGGLDRFRDGAFTPLGSAEGLPNDAVASVLETRDCSLWTFCDGRGVVRMRKGKNRVFTTKDGLASNFGGPLFEAKDGSLWIGHDNGLSRLRGESATAYREGELHTRYVSSITEDKDGLIVYVLGVGLRRFRDGRLRPYPLTDPSFDIRMAFAMHVSRDGALWMATNRGVISVRNGSPRLVWTAPRWAVATSILEDAEGTIWVGTWRGILRIAGDAVTLIDTSKGLHHNRILAVLEDHHGFLWFSSPHGVFRVRRHELDEVAVGPRERVTSDVFGHSDGMRSAEATGPASPSGWVTSDRRLWFTTRQGLVSVDPSHIAQNPLPPPVVLEEVVVDGVSSAVTGVVHVPADTQRVQFLYNGLSLLAPERVRFRYRLEGYDDGWVEAGSRRTAYYTSIPPGRHIFRVTACNNDGVWNERGVAVTIDVGRHWYTTPWFYAGLAILLAGAVALAYRMRIRSLRDNERLLEERIRDRTAALRSEIAEREKAETALRQSEERYELAVRGTNEGIWDWDFVSERVYLSPLWKVILGCENTELGDGADEWFARVHPDDVDRVRGKLMGYRGSPVSHYADEFRMRHADGGYRWILSRGYAVRNPEGRCERLVGAISDVTMHRAYDPLTGLANRTLFMERLSDAFQRSSQDPTRRCAVALLDLDRFQRMNDSLGHAFGDGLLVAVAKRIEGALRPGDIVGRLAGDDFALLIEGIAEVEDASHVALRIRDDLARPFVIAGTEAFLSATMGVAVWSERYARAEDLVRDASTALHEASARGRNQIEVFHEGMRALVVSTLELETALRRALERSELVLHFQPVVSLRSGLTEGFEALVRWNHPERGLIYPGDFIPLAEETRLIHPLGRLVRRAACEQLQAWRAQARGAEGLWMSVNASGREFAEPELAREVRALLRTYRLAPSAFHIEITETVLVDGDPRVASTLARLRDLGIPLDIDDFGTGFSSLSYLQQIPASTLKIDRSFVARLGAGGRGEAVVQTILALARSLGLLVVAEGVETPEQLAALERLGCHSVQGYLLARPVPAAQAAEFIGVPMLPERPAPAQDVQ